MKFLDMFFWCAGIVLLSVVLLSVVLLSVVRFTALSPRNVDTVAHLQVTPDAASDGQIPVHFIDKVRECKKDSDCRKLAEAVVFEARGESQLGQYAVAWVVMNRVMSKHWPNSVQRVLHQPRQFEYISNMRQQTKPTHNDWTRAYKIAYDVLNNVILSPVGNATYYHAANIKPTWTQDLVFIARIDNHLFYKRTDND